MVTSVGRLLERDRELRRIGAMLDRAVEGAGGTLVLEGVAGIGKTRLARAVRQEAAERGFLPLVARGTELERDYPFGVVRQLLEPTVRVAGSAERARLLDGAAALAAGAVLPEAATVGVEADPTFGVLHGLYWLCANLAERRPLLLVVDDAHWADEQSLRFLSFLTHRVETLALVVLVTVRSGVTGAEELASEAAAERLSLRPLSAVAVASFLRLRTVSAVDPDFAGACHAATGGNPFLLDQLVQALVERDVSFAADAAGLVETVGPEAVSTAVLGRISRLGAAASALARASAVLGDDTRLALAAELAELDESAAAEAASALAGVGVLEDARPLRFEHPIVRDAVEAALRAGERVRLHRRAAGLLAADGAPAAEVAVHLLPTDPGAGDPWVVDTLAEAARQALARGAPATAIPLLARAVTEPPPDRERVAFLLDLGRVESQLGRPEAFEHLETAHRLAADPLERGRCALALGWARMIDQASDGEVMPVVERSIAESSSLDRELTLELEAVHVALLSARGLLPTEAAAQLERFADLGGETRAECALLGHLAHLRMDTGSSAANAAELAERVLANERVVMEVGFDAAWLLACILVLRGAERYEGALRALDLALEAARRRGAEAGFATASVLRASVFLNMGDIPAAEADARAALDAAQARNWLWLPSVAMLVDVLVESDRLDEAEELLSEHRALGELPDVRPATVLVLSRAGLRAAQGRLVEALADLDLAQRRLVIVTSRSVVGLDGRLRRALVAHTLSETSEARIESADSVELARAWGTPGLIGNALRVQALVAGGAEAVVGLTEAVESLAGSSRRLDHARALGDLGAALRREGDRVAAREPLRRALALAHECGGIAVRERAREELAATGVRVRREAQTGVQSLTPSEQRIAKRAAAGASNREIAQALFVTVKTVEMHLGHTYRKLGISSRGELAAAIGKGFGAVDT
jgi:DNA-binding CsgD family transcriptional regulator